MAVFKKGKYWYIDYYVNGKRIRECSRVTSKREAERFLNKRLTAVAENKFMDIRQNKKILFEEMSKLYYENYSIPNKKSFHRDRTSIRNLNDFFKGRYLYTISQEMVEKYKAIRKKEVTPASVNRELACLKHIFTKAREWNKIDFNPAKRVKLYKEDNNRVRCLSDEEIGLLIENCPEFLKSMVITSIHTGMRKGELLNLKWSDIDFSHGLITVNETKSGESRKIEMNYYLTDTLKIYRMSRVEKDGYVFVDETGKRYSPHGIMKGAFKRTLKKAGITDFRWHDMRHVFASRLAMQGTNIIAIMELLGHKSLKMTRRYSNISSDYKRKAVEGMCSGIDTIWTPAKNEQGSKKQ